MEIIQHVVIETDNPGNDEIPDYKGIQLDDADLANKICNEYRISPSKLIWIKYFPEQKENDTESFNLIIFNIEDRVLRSFPRWIGISREVAEAFKKQAKELELNLALMDKKEAEV